MFQCPVCQTKYVAGQIDRCSICNWDLNSYPLIMGLIPDFLQKEQAKADWAKRLWAASKLQQEQIQELQLQLNLANKKELALQSQLEKAHLELTLQEAALKHQQPQLDQTPPESQQSVSGAEILVISSPEIAATPSPLPITTPTIKEEFSFGVVTLDAQGQQTESHISTATLERLDLGNGVILEMIDIPGGSFWMGSPETEEGRDIHEGPQHQVTLLPFSLSKFPITQAQWQAIASLPQINRSLNPEPSSFKGANHPVEQVSWHDAREFCARLKRITGRNYRLPSEAEWEYACRAGTTTPFHFGQTITPNLANYDGNFSYGSGVKGQYGKQTTPVGNFQVANAFGLYDMHGLVWEWCADPWHENYQDAPVGGEVWESGGNNHYRLLRGGSWYCLPTMCRAAQRHWDHPDNGGSGIGFRVVSSAAQSVPNPYF
jgi:formylglycine-generating enzyme required for sulfatase activity